MNREQAKQQAIDGCYEMVCAKIIMRAIFDTASKDPETKADAESFLDSDYYFLLLHMAGKYSGYVLRLRQEFAVNPSPRKYQMRAKQ